MASRQSESTSRAVTRGVCVEVRAHYSPEHSRPQDSQWFFLYTIRISNEGDETVQLISRHWVIRDAADKVEEVRGPGVIGEQPVLDPGDSFEYTSGCPLATPFGTMEGSYQMVTADGESFEADIAPFALMQPAAIH